MPAESVIERLKRLEADVLERPKSRFVTMETRHLSLLLRVTEAADAWERATDASDAELERTEKALDTAVRALRAGGSDVRR